MKAIKRRLNFVSSWCIPCRMEIPQLKSLHQKFSKHKSFDVVSVSYDVEVGNCKKILVYKKMPWQQLIKDSKVNAYTKDLFSFYKSISTNLLVDSNGKIMKKFVGFEEKNNVELG